MKMLIIKWWRQIAIGQTAQWDRVKKIETTCQCNLNKILMNYDHENVILILKFIILN